MIFLDEPIWKSRIQGIELFAGLGIHHLPPVTQFVSPFQFPGIFACPGSQGSSLAEVIVSLALISGFAGNHTEQKISFGVIRLADILESDGLALRPIAGLARIGGLFQQRFLTGRIDIDAIGAHVGDQIVRNLPSQGRCREILLAIEVVRIGFHPQDTAIPPYGTAGQVDIVTIRRRAVMFFVLLIVTVVIGIVSSVPVHIQIEMQHGVGPCRRIGNRIEPAVDQTLLHLAH